MISLSKERRSVLISVAGIGVAILFCILIAQFFRLQVIEHKRWVDVAAKQHFFIIKEPFKRGSFYSNLSVMVNKPSRKVAFATDVLLYHLYADPKGIPVQVRSEVVESIVKILSPEVKEGKKITNELCRKSRSRKIVSWINERQKGLFLSWWRPYAKKHKIAPNALFFVEDYKRFHPMGRLLGQVLHSIQDRRHELTLKAYPTGGLELALNSILDGSIGYRRLMRSPHNSLETGEVLKSPIHGADVELTINHCLQAIVEEELEKGCCQHNAKSGMAVMVDPKTGEILALAQYPFFHPDRYKEYFNNAQLIEHSKLKAAYDVNEPGSPMKALTMAIALKANRELKNSGKPPVFHPFEKVPTSSGMLPGRPKALVDVHQARFLNMYMAMQKSSNIYMATIAGRIVRSLGEEWYRNELYSSFGFGQKTGVELIGESVGVLPKPKKMDAAGRLEWSKPTPYSLAIGYNVTVTGLQFARAYCVLANGGILPDLTLVRRIYKDVNGSDETIVDHTDSKRLQKFKRVFAKEDIAEVVRAMKFVTKSGGTASKADVYGYTEVGKTGTSMKLVGGQYSNRAHFASFAGFTPASNPAFVLFVALDEPKVGYVPGRGLNHHGGTCAAPIFREISRRSLEFLGVPMDDPYGFPLNDPRCDVLKADYAKENEQLTKLYQQWNGR